MTDQPFDLSQLAELRADDAVALPGPWGAPATFAYVGQAFSPETFAAYVAGYAFGPIPPDSIVLHHTSIPDASWAPCPGAKSTWDAGEGGMTRAQKVAKRLAQVTRLKEYYRLTMGWNAGPHLIVDDLAIYALTPMAAPGIHAKWGNSWRDPSGRLHYPVGVEVVGHYEHTPWPAPVAAMVASAVLALQHRLGTFQLVYPYDAPESKPGMKVVKDEQVCAHPERLRPGGITSHRDFNKPACPGGAITEGFYLGVLTSAARAATVPPPPVLRGTTYTADSPLWNTRSLDVSRLVPVLDARTDQYDAKAIATILAAYVERCALVGLDVLLVVAQLLHETDWLRSFWSARPQRNPAGIGVNGRKDPAAPPTRKPPAARGEDWAYNDRASPPRWEMGLSFDRWEHSADAHVGRLLAYLLKPNTGTPEQRRLIDAAMALRPLPDALRGSVDRLAELGCAHNPVNAGKPEAEWMGWARPGYDYGARVAAVATALEGAMSS